MNQKIIIGLQTLTLFFLLNISLKLVYCSLRIRYGNKLIKNLISFSNNKSKLECLYPTFKLYCKKANIKLLSYPYNLLEPNLLNKTVQSAIISSLNKAVGVYQIRRRYCYILFTINDNKKCITILVTLVDVLIKLITSLCTANIDILVEFLKDMLF